MSLESTSCNKLSNFIIHDTIFATTSPLNYHHNPPSKMAVQPHNSPDNTQNVVLEGGEGRKKKRRKKQRVCKNKEEAETQRMTHIVVERNRRKTMNHHLDVLRSLLPESYTQRGDQASIVGGAISCVKELEHLLQSLEAQKFNLTRQHQQDVIIHDQNSNFTINRPKEYEIPQTPLYFQKLFSYPQYTWYQHPNKNISKSNATMANIEVNLVQTHANLRILMRKQATQLSKIVVLLQTCCLTALHLNVTTLDPFVLYSISLKVEEGCWLNSADEIAEAVHDILGLIAEEATLSVDSKNQKWQACHFQNYP